MDNRGLLQALREFDEVINQYGTAHRRGVGHVTLWLCQNTQWQQQDKPTALRVVMSLNCRNSCSLREKRRLVLHNLELAALMYHGAQEGTRTPTKLLAST